MACLSAHTHNLRASLTSFAQEDPGEGHGDQTQPHHRMFDRARTTLSRIHTHMNAHKFPSLQLFLLLPRANLAALVAAGLHPASHSLFPSPLPSSLPFLRVSDFSFKLIGITPIVQSRSGFGFPGELEASIRRGNLEPLSSTLTARKKQVFVPSALTSACYR